MADQREAPTIPPVNGWFTVTKDAAGNITVEPTQALYKLIVGEFAFSRNVNSGVNLARHEAAQAAGAAATAQATAEAAAQQAQDVGAEALPFSASVNPLYASDTTTGGGQTATTNSVTVTPAGGTAPYTYAWTKDSGDDFVLSGASSATTTFSIAVLPAGETRTAVYRCTVTDSAAATTTVTVSVSVWDITF